MNFLTLAALNEGIRSGEWNGTISVSSSDEIPSKTDLIQILDRKGELFQNICHGDKVILKISHSVESALSFVVLWNRGAVIVPVKHEISDEAIRDIGQDCNARFVYDAESSALTQFDSYQKETQIFKFRSEPRVSGNDLALLIYTSGSTGRPKGIMLTHSNVVSALFAIAQYLDLQSSDRILCISPLSFDYGLYQLLFTFARNCHLVLYDQAAQPLGIIKALKQKEITVLPFVPVIASGLERVLRVFKQELPHLQKVTNTGGHLPEAVIKGLKDTIPHVHIYAMYGLTECKRALYLPPQDLDRKIGSVGIPMPGLEAKVFIEGLSDKTGEHLYHEAGSNEIGELFVRGASMMQSYYSEAQGGARIIPGKYRDDNWLATGDLFLQDEEGYFYFKGRTKDLIKQGGYCLYPLDIEEVVTSHKHIEVASVVGKTDKQGVEIAQLFIKITDSSTALQKEIEKWVKDTVDPDYRPREIHFIDDVPVCKNGKVDKKALAQL